MEPVYECLEFQFPGDETLTSCLFPSLSSFARSCLRHSQQQSAAGIETHNCALRLTLTCRFDLRTSFGWSLRKLQNSSGP
jgi:hypothetical protein